MKKFWKESLTKDLPMKREAKKSFISKIPIVFENDNGLSILGGVLGFILFLPTIYLLFKGEVDIGLYYLAGAFLLFAIAFLGVFERIYYYLFFNRKLENYFDGLIFALDAKCEELAQPFEDKTSSYQKIQNSKTQILKLIDEYNTVKDQEFSLQKVQKLNSILENNVVPAVSAVDETKSKVDVVINKIKTVIEEIQEKKKVYLLSRKENALIKYTKEELQNDLNQFFMEVFTALKVLPELENEIRQIKIEMWKTFSDHKSVDQLADEWLEIDEESKLMEEI